MPPLQKRFDATPLQVLTDIETRERIRALHKVSGKSQAEVMRDLIADALPGMERFYGITPPGAPES